MKNVDQNKISLPNFMRGLKNLSRTLTNSGPIPLITPVFKFLFLSRAVTQQAAQARTRGLSAGWQYRRDGHLLLFLCHPSQDDIKDTSGNPKGL